MNIMKRYFILVVALMGVAAVADAECRKAWVCDDYGRNCKVKQICDSTIDLPSVEVDPIKPLPSVELKPLPSVELPPIGTKKCEYKQVNGVWKNVCK